jgi:Protein of unknown function (DUF1761)
VGHIDYVAVLAAALVGFAVGAVWYSPVLFGRIFRSPRSLDRSSAPHPVIETLGEFARCFVMAGVLGAFVHVLGIDNWRHALGLGLCVGLGFQATILAGAVLHERMPLKLYAVHAGDGVVKISLMALVLALWQ